MRSLIWLLVACGSSAQAPAVATDEWTDFYTIQYHAPKGTDARVTRSVLPGPGGLGGSPVDERPYVTLVSNTFYVTITKTQERSTLDATKASYVANNVGVDHRGAPTSTGWEMTYTTKRSDDPTKPSTGHLVYAELGGGNYQCSYDEQNCKDPAAAAAICRSMRIKP
jgi:hypothetical protein